MPHAPQWDAKPARWRLPASEKHTMDLLGKLYKDYTSTDFIFPELSSFLKAEIRFSPADFAIVAQSFPVDSPPPEFA